MKTDGLSALLRITLKPRSYFTGSFSGKVDCEKSSVNGWLHPSLIPKVASFQDVIDPIRRQETLSEICPQPGAGASEAWGDKDRSRIVIGGEKTRHVHIEPVHVKDNRPVFSKPMEFLSVVTEERKGPPYGPPRFVVLRWIFDPVSWLAFSVDRYKATGGQSWVHAGNAKRKLIVVAQILRNGKDIPSAKRCSKQTASLHP